MPTVVQMEVCLFAVSFVFFSGHFVNSCLISLLYVLSSVFEECSKVISSAPFVTSCRLDNCKSGNNSCSSLEAYATECANAGICVDWRNATDGQCGKTNEQYNIAVVVWSVWMCA